MKILALETSAKAVLRRRDRGRAPFWPPAIRCTGLTHSRTLMPMVEGILANAGIRAGETA
jgi:tRNA threonylcarbamoyladenosine biosynthesis protein TsaB